MLVQLVASSVMASFIAQAPKPPVDKYDPKSDVTTYSTGDVRTAGNSGYGAQFEFRGKTQSIATSIAMGFGALRLTHGRGPEHEKEVLHWNDVKSISLTFSGKKQVYPASHIVHPSTNWRVARFLGRALEEALSISLTPAQFRDLASTDSIHVQLGKDTQVIRGKSLGPLKRLAACLPPH
jgi:hypothetical protein